MRTLSTFSNDGLGRSRPRNTNSGHRQRLRARLERAGLDALADYEILEFLLGLAIRGRDVKPLARTLLKAFGGSLGRLLDAPRADVLAVPGAGPAVADALLAARTASVAALRDRAARADALSNPRLVADYCRARFAGEPQEVVAALLLDSRHRVVKTALLSRRDPERAKRVEGSRGTVDRSLPRRSSRRERRRAAAFPGEVARAALKEGAAAVILAHNHPSGCPEAVGSN